MRCFVDRIEEYHVVLIDENEQQLRIDRNLAPDDITDGSVLISSEQGKFIRDIEFEKTRRKAMHARIEKLKNR